MLTEKIVRINQYKKFQYPKSFIHLCRICYRISFKQEKHCHDRQGPPKASDGTDVGRRIGGQQMWASGASALPTGTPRDLAALQTARTL